MEQHVMEAIDYHVRHYLEAMVSSAWGTQHDLTWHSAAIAAAYDYTDDIDVAMYANDVHRALVDLINEQR